jgi:hypothetical protein
MRGSAMGWIGLAGRQCAECGKLATHYTDTGKALCNECDGITLAHKDRDVLLSHIIALIDVQYHNATILTYLSYSLLGLRFDIRYGREET